MTDYVLEHAWVDGELRSEVAVSVQGGRFTSVGGPPRSDARRLTGLTVPGLANCHSHAFHRALRGRTHHGGGTFWTWREQMYRLAERLDPDSYRALAVAVFREMVASGITSVGEFHYLHHRRDGGSYDEPNVMGLALVAAAREAGLRIALLDTCYLAAGIGRPIEGVQRRFSDGTAEAWQERADELTGDAAGDVVVGAAIHSVRAVPLDQMRLVAEWADRFETPLHVHLSEQAAENEECLASYGRTPTEVLAEAGALSDRTSAVHATHLTDLDVTRLGSSNVTACFCPTTERDLGDGVGPSRALLEAGCPVTLGSDSHAVIDLFEEMKALEMDQRSVHETRGHWGAAELLRAATGDGHASLGFPDAGRIAVGQRADLVTLDLATPRTAGAGASAETVAFAATSADVVHVVSGGRVVHRAGDSAEVGAQLDKVVRGLWEGM
ncbi:MAG TPA: formimidoylglutamate deiminase [Marmoricola sp.]|nr:formimidoylglutamate deiminase [Marmoricola sp.]